MDGTKTYHTSESGIGKVPGSKSLENLMPFVFYGCLKEEKEVPEVTSHTFSDASEKAYAMALCTP